MNACVNNSRAWLPPLGGPDQPMLEAYTPLGALAARTRRVQLGTLDGRPVHSAAR